MNVALELQPCCWQRSGIGSYTYEIVRRIRDTGDISFHGNLFHFLGRRDNSAVLGDISIPVNTNKLIPYAVYRRIWDCIPIPYDSLFEKADISVFFNFIVPPGVGGTVISVVHDMTYLRYPETMQRSNYIRLKKGMEKSLKRSDIVVTTSFFTKHEVQELMGVPDEKISVIHSAPVLDASEADFAQLQAKYGIRRPYILFVSTLEPRKNVVRLICAFEWLKDQHHIPHQLVFAGGKGWRDEEILSKAETSPYRSEMAFTGFVSNAEKNTLYRQADELVFPSIYEGFGMPPLEAMYFGCPVVCANAASVPEIVGDAAHLVDPFCVESIGKGMLDVLSDSQLANNLREKGKQRASVFSWERSLEELYHVLNLARDK